ncbi:hypothetical protein ANACOL_03290 [Anaerotruncus colihominis DSM 17241]|uniref:Uncharacterized protein n=1 Tax=Anaerotruncus colihominis DSM 17241 TaxID=445972 RepID=B0PER2_9FIRM|nr:hypothetical protein ANACOL_03290 [Anaerotruncus colihominis DSM 17241]
MIRRLSFNTNKNSIFVGIIRHLFCNVNPDFRNFSSYIESIPT